MLNRLPYYQYVNMLAYLDEIINAENGKKSNGEDVNDPMGSAREMQEDMMGRARNMMKHSMPSNFKMPSMGKLKP